MLFFCWEFSIVLPVCSACITSWFKLNVGNALKVSQSRKRKSSAQSCRIGSRCMSPMHTKSPYHDAYYIASL